MIGDHPVDVPAFSVALKDEAYCTFCQARARIIEFNADHGGAIAAGSAAGTLVHDEFHLTVAFFEAVSQWISVDDPAEQDLAEELDGTALALRQIVLVREMESE